MMSYRPRQCLLAILLAEDAHWSKGDVMAYFAIGKDYETSERCGAGGMFQIESLSLNEVDVINSVDQGMHFSIEEPEQLRDYLRVVFKIPASEGIDIDEI